MLGNRKLLIFFIVPALLLSLFVVSASAEEVVRGPDSLGSRSVFAPKYTLTESGLSSFYDYLTSEEYSQSNPFIFTESVYYVPVNTGQGYKAVSSIYPTSSYFHIDYVDGTSASLYLGVGTLGFDSSNMYNSFVSFGLSYSDFTYGNEVLSVGSAAQSLFSSILAVGSKLVSFVIASPIVLLPLVAFILVLSTGVIRRLIKGV